jgi:hypothetical protein
MTSFPTFASGPAPVDDEILSARAYLSRVAEPASLALWEFVADCARSRRRT